MRCEFFDLLRRIEQYSFSTKFDKVALCFVLFTLSCDLNDDHFFGKYELDRGRDGLPCQVDLQEGGQGVVDCDGPILINWVRTADNHLIIDTRGRQMNFSPVDFDTTLFGVRPISWKGGSQGGATLKFIQ